MLYLNPNTLKNQIYEILSGLTIFAYFIPIFIVLFRQLWVHSAFLLFSVYWGLNGIVNGIKRYDLVAEDMKQLITLAYNMVDMPLVLVFIYLCSSSSGVRKFTQVSAPVLFFVGLINFILQGWNYPAAKYVMGLGLLMVMIAVIWEIGNYTLKLEHSSHEKTLLCFYVSLFFAYGTFVIVYIFLYYVRIRDAAVDNYLIYYFSSLIAIAISSFGFLRIRSIRMAG
jgi:hypothetical protein